MSISPLFISQTDETPEVSFNISRGQLNITGRSLPENAHTFYQPLIDWVREYVHQPAQTTEMNIKLDYFNSSSGRFLLELLSVMEEKLKDKKNIRVKWYSEQDDELMIEKGEEFSSLLDIPFEFVKH